MFQGLRSQGQEIKYALKDHHQEPRPRTNITTTRPATSFLYLVPLSRIPQQLYGLSLLLLLFLIRSARTSDALITTAWIEFTTTTILIWSARTSGALTY